MKMCIFDFVSHFDTKKRVLCGGFEMNKIIIEGVALFLVALETGRILVVKELQSKTGIKEKGMLSIPAETSHPEEEDRDTLGRLFHEEIGIDPILCEKIALLHWINGRDFRADVSLFVGSVDREFPPSPQDGEDVAFHAWMYPEELLSSWVRSGVAESTEHFLRWRDR
ncbi:MAG: NUDIX hydrolase [Candidatus Moranbacteria bacterium]|nr:NUDIX hydrolase [Candidatus Moranbacteria bacterium]